MKRAWCNLMIRAADRIMDRYDFIDVPDTIARYDGSCGWNIYDNAREVAYIYKKVYDEWQGCMPCTHQHLREHFALPGRPVPIDNSTGRLGVTGGLRRCQVIPTGWLWFSGTKTNSAAVIQYRFPDNLSTAKVFFRTRPHILPIPIHYR